MMFKRLKMVNSVKKKMQRRGNVFEVFERPRMLDENIEEERELMFLRHRMNERDMGKYEYLFRFLCRNPNAVYDFELRATE